jgi:hypothetical protein
MSNENTIGRRDLLNTAGVAGLALLGVAVPPTGAEAGLKDYPALAKGHDFLLDAKKVLEKGKEEFGGHRVKAIRLIDDALEEIKKAVKVADGK